MTVVVRVPGAAALARSPGDGAGPDPARPGATAGPAGLTLVMALDVGVTVKALPNPARDVVRLATDLDIPHAVVAVDPAVRHGGGADPWGLGLLVAAVCDELRPTTGFVVKAEIAAVVSAGLDVTVPLAAAVALAFGADGRDPVGLARRVTRIAAAVRPGHDADADQLDLARALAVLTGRAGHALAVDTGTLTARAVPVDRRLRLGLPGVPAVPLAVPVALVADALVRGDLAGLAELAGTPVGPTEAVVATVGEVTVGERSPHDGASGPEVRPADGASVPFLDR